jgi:hypothetical protein
MLPRDKYTITGNSNLAKMRRTDMLEYNIIDLVIACGVASEQKIPGSSGYDTFTNVASEPRDVKSTPPTEATHVPAEKLDMV